MQSTGAPNGVAPPAVGIPSRFARRRPLNRIPGRHKGAMATRKLRRHIRSV